jgi:acetate kinase
MKILVLNSGSSSQKSCLYEIGDKLPSDPPACTWEGKIEWEDHHAQFTIKNSQGASRKDQTPVGSRGEAVERLLTSLWSGDAQGVSSPSDVDVVGHRVVHGGPQYFEPALVTADVKTAIEDVSVFAPLHNRAELEGMHIVWKLLGSVPQVAVFDTGFHRNMPLAAKTYPGPYEWFEQGIRRYGFHGINHQYCAERAALMLGKDKDKSKDLDSPKLVTCHLGNGCSLAAIRGGRSVDTTMGFTPLEGLMMGTRSGSVDPGVLTYLMRKRHFLDEQLDDVLNKKSGLLGISGFSSDMREIVAARANGAEPAKMERARLAFDMYVHRLRSGIGAMAAVLGGIDGLVFSAGVGEHSAEVRAAVCDHLAFLGVRLDLAKNDPAKNAQPPSDQDTDIAALDAPVRVFVIHAQEDWMIARQCWHLLQAA